MISATIAGNAKRYVERVNDLYDLIGKWVKEIDPRTELVVSNIPVNAGELGIYEAPQLTIRRPNAEEIHLVPRGHHMIASQGRVDVKSRLDSESLVYLPEGGFSIRTTVHAGDEAIDKHDNRIAPDIAEGWVWLENETERSLPSLDREAFSKLLATLSL